MNLPVKTATGDIIESVITKGDLERLTPEERAKYYVSVCQSIGLNPMTRPFEYIKLNGKLTLYARKDCTDQLRAMHKVSVTELSESEREGVFVVTAKVADQDGRTDISKGAVTIIGLKGDALANALMKAETKAKRRATLSICGLGFLDETEVEDVARRVALPSHDPVTGEIEATESHERFIAETRERIRTASDYTELGAWWNSDDQKQQRRLFDLTGQELQELIDFVTERREQLKQKAA